MAVVEVTISPCGTGTPSVSKYVAAVEKVLAEEAKAGDVKYQLTPMSTIIEGDVDRVLAIIRKMHEEPFKMGLQRVSTLIRIDDRRDKKLTMDGKIKAVMSKL